MLNKKGMVLIESLLLMMICMFLVSIVLLCAQSMYQMEKADEGGYHDEEIQEIYQS